MSIEQMAPSQNTVIIQFLVQAVVCRCQDVFSQLLIVFWHVGVWFVYFRNDFCEELMRSNCIKLKLIVCIRVDWYRSTFALRVHNFYMWRRFFNEIKLAIWATCQPLEGNRFYYKWKHFLFELIYHIFKNYSHSFENIIIWINHCFDTHLIRNQQQSHPK